MLYLSSQFLFFFPLPLRFFCRFYFALVIRGRICRFSFFPRLCVTDCAFFCMRRALTIKTQFVAISIFFFFAVLVSSPRNNSWKAYRMNETCHANLLSSQSLFHMPFDFFLFFCGAAACAKRNEFTWHKWEIVILSENEFINI